MQKHGINLDLVFNSYNMSFSMKTICQLGIRVINILEAVHEAGYVYNDIKLDNILIGDSHNREDS